jgi:hypothetical protein
VAQLLGRHPVRQQGRDEGAGAGTDVQVEVADPEALEERVEREQRSHLVESPDDPAAREHERAARRASLSLDHRHVTEDVGASALRLESGRTNMDGCTSGCLCEGHLPLIVRVV